MNQKFGNIPKSATLHPSSFEVAIPEATLTEFKTLLKLSKTAPETYEGAQVDRKYGVTTKWIREAKGKWENDFDWRKHESHINSFPNFIAPIVDDDGMEYKIHFIGLFSEKEDAVPIIFLHGWPGNFLEFFPILSILSNRYTAATLPYHVVVPSLPGYTFSSGPPLDKDFQVQDIARIIDKLAVGLGFGGGYVAQGGDLGSRVARILGSEYHSCKAVHVNFCVLPHAYKPSDSLENLTDADRKGIVRTIEYMKTGSAYGVVHGTRPSTIGHALSSSPVALLAWIGEKFLEWTDEDPPLDVILESVTLYWFTETFPRAIYPYRQSFSSAPTFSWYVKKPFGFSQFPRDIAPTPQTWAATAGNLVFYRLHDKGGHFAALECPDVLLKDVQDFIIQVWPDARNL